MCPASILAEEHFGCQQVDKLSYVNQQLAAPPCILLAAQQRYCPDVWSLQITGSDKNGITQAKVATILFAAKASAYNW